jgi:hypothetical protein
MSMTPEVQEAIVQAFIDRHFEDGHAGQYFACTLDEFRAFAASLPSTPSAPRQDLGGPVAARVEAVAWYHVRFPDGEIEWVEGDDRERVSELLQDYAALDNINQPRVTNLYTAPPIQPDEAGECKCGCNSRICTEFRGAIGRLSGEHYCANCCHDRECHELAEGGR